MKMKGGTLTVRLEQCLDSNIGKEKDMIQFIKATGNAYESDVMSVDDSNK